MAEFGQVLAEIGDFSRFQIQLLVLLSIPNFLSSFYMFGQIFMVLEEPHHCSVAWVKNQTLNLSTTEQLALSVPLDTNGHPEPCLMFQPPPDNASLDDILGHRFNETQPCDAGWDYPENRAPSLLNEVGSPFSLSLDLPLGSMLWKGVLEFWFTCCYHCLFFALCLLALVPHYALLLYVPLSI